MVTGIIGKKVGMTQLFKPDGSVQPVTVIKAGPCVVVQAKSVETDGYQAVQIGLVEDKPAKVSKPLAGHYKKAAVPPTREHSGARPDAIASKSAFDRPSETDGRTKTDVPVSTIESVYCEVAIGTLAPPTETDTRFRAYMNWERKEEDSGTYVGAAVAIEAS
jgi:ribosomal protein L3